MESLSPECTPLKHRYDSCFNAWFEGYLQPALSAAAATATASSSASASSSTSTSTPSPSSIPTPSSPALSVPQPVVPNLEPKGVNPAQPQPQPTPKKPIITSWASAFPSRHRRPVPPSGHGQGGQPEEGHWYDFVLPEEDEDAYPHGEVVEGQEGKTRAQIKAEEYQRNCGKAWEDYQGCLKKAIAQNESLSTLLETAREEHPLGRLDELKGTPWDSKADFTANDS